MSGPICDAHHHLWLRPGMEYLSADLLADLATVPAVRRTVFVECGAWYRDDGPEHLRPVGETEWVVANGGDSVEAIVGTGDLRLGDRTVEMLDAHIAAGDGRFRGIRQRATWDAAFSTDPDPGPSLLLDPDFRRGFRTLTDLGLSFDAWLYFPQLPELVDLARVFPDATIVLNHLGAPITRGPYADREQTHATWRRLMADVATCPNVVLKLGGIGMPMFGSTWHRRPDAPPAPEVVAAEWGDPIRSCIELFGPERCMFESNFPVDRVSMTYATLWGAFDLITARYSPAERRDLFHDTAVRTYRLSPEEHLS